MVCKRGFNQFLGNTRLALLLTPIRTCLTTTTPSTSAVTVHTSPTPPLRSTLSMLGVMAMFENLFGETVTHLSSSPSSTNPCTTGYLKECVLSHQNVCARQHQVAEVELATDSERTLMGCADPPSNYGGRRGAPHQCSRINQKRSG